LLIREALAQGSADLKFANIESSSLDASILLAHILKTERTALFASGTDLISDDACAAYCDLIQRRRNGECVAYLTGKKEFMGLEFIVNNSVLVPRPETETLVETALTIYNEQLAMNNEQLTEKNVKFYVLDLCTGSGAVAISLKHEMPELEVYASDISVNALGLAETNAAGLLSKENCINFFIGDIYSAISYPLPKSIFSLIISNPPYIPSGEIETLPIEVQNEPRIALDGGDSGLEIIERIINGAPDFLKNGGFLLMEADPRQMSAITILLEKRGFSDIQLYKDLSGSKRVIGGRYEK